MTGIYAIINNGNGKRYVGQAVHIKKRVSKHFSDLKANRHHCEHLQRAFTKYGYEKFTYTVLHVCEKNNLTEREQYWIDYYKDKGIYNTALYAGGSCLGMKRSAETRKKMSIALMGKKHSDESRKKQSIAQLGQKRGKREPFSLETRRKMSIAKKGKPLSIEHRAKISQGLIGNSNTKGYKYLTVNI
jgi:group I intron endonuclease